MIQASTSPTAGETNTHITQPHIRLWVKWLWIVLFVARCIYSIASAVTQMQIRMTLCAAEPCNPLQVTTASYEIFAQAGIPFAFRVLYNPILELLTWLIAAGIGLYIFMRRSDDWMALTVAMLLVVLGGSSQSAALALPSLYPFAAVISTFWGVFAAVLSYIILCTFPDGRFVPRWIGWALAPLLIWGLYGTWIRYSRLLRDDIGLPFIVLVLLGIAAQLYRYQRVSSPIQRQQSKWVLIGITLALLFFILNMTFYFSTYDPVTKSQPPLAYIVGNTVGIPSVLVLPLGIAFSVMRYRLWNVDLILNKSLVFSFLTLLLGIVLVALFFGVNALIKTVLGEQNAAASIAISGVLVGLLFGPARARMQNLVDKRLFNLRFDLNQLERSQETTPIKNPGALTGRTLGDYELRDVLGKGGMGEVYLGHSPAQIAAVKILPPEYASNTMLIKRFEREAAVMQSLSHEKIVRLYEFGEADSIYYMALEYIAGSDLSEKLKAGGPLALPDVQRILQNIADALDYAHGKGLIHRDIKPSNIMLRDSSAGDAVLMDFGIVRVSDETSALTDTAVIGTIDYMAPEQITSSHDVDARADIYALGVVAFEMLTGHRPFSGGPAQVLFAHLQQPPPDPRKVGDGVSLPQQAAEAILKALAKDAGQRFRSAGEFVSALTVGAEETATVW